jgi:hypothetical protein
LAIWYSYSEIVIDESRWHLKRFQELGKLIVGCRRQGIKAWLANPGENKPFLAAKMLVTS